MCASASCAAPQTALKRRRGASTCSFFAVGAVFDTLLSAPSAELDNLFDPGSDAAGILGQEVASLAPPEAGGHAHGLVREPQDGAI